MLRSIILFLSRVEWARRLLTSWGFARRTARRFVAGETAQDAIQVAQELNKRGIMVSLDHLGENTTSPEEATQATNAILHIIELIQQAEVRANVSIKLSQIGLALDSGLTHSHLHKILDKAKAGSIFVRIDMEESRFTQATLDIYCEMRSLGYENLGVVIQTYLYRSEADILKLVELDARVRVCKGAYNEPAELAFPRKQDVDVNFDQLVVLLLDNALESGVSLSNDGRTPPLPAIATHDPARIIFAKDYAQQITLAKDKMEFQFLHGIRRDLQEALIKEDYPVRVYVPYGTHWYPYLMRRLAEHPANLWFFISNFIRR